MPPKRLSTHGEEGCRGAPHNRISGIFEGYNKRYLLSLKSRNLEIPRWPIK
jgi:hypothetical protein